jgi:tripartite ATP-independent transporter DctM subunit
MSTGLITLLMFGSMLVAILLGGVPVAFALGGISTIMTILLLGSQSLYISVSNVWGLMSEFLLVAIPLFVFMANVLQHSGVADDLYELVYHWMGRLRGGLAIGTIGICTIMAAMTGISATATISMGLIALPSMLKRGYSPLIAIGTVSAGGALGVLIPPSVLLILYGQLAQVSVGKLFVGGVLPGILLAALFVAYVVVRSAWQKNLCPSVPPEESISLRKKLVMLWRLVIPIFMIVSVLGSIYLGIATPSEAAAVGAAGSILVAAITRRLNWKMIKDASMGCLGLTCMCMWIMMGASVFSHLYTAMGAQQLIQEIVASLPVGRWIIFVGIQLIWFILGCLMDGTAILMLSMPVFLPIIKNLGFDPLWFGVVFVVNMEMGFLTPPFGFNLFYMKAIVPKGITMNDIYRSVIPFIFLQGVGLIVTILFPQIITWLPNRMIR